MTTHDVAPQASIAELSRQVRSGALSPVALTQSVLDRIDQLDGTLNAYISIYAEQAQTAAAKAAAEIKRGHYRGPLHGIPMGLKDNLYMQGQTTTIGSKIHADFVPDTTATVIRKLQDNGVVVLGKLNLHEYALGVTCENAHHGTCHNPWQRQKIAGGSSGGAGVALAAGLTVGSLGTDTSGSIRIPGSACGVAGLKPTYGLVSKFGCFSEAWSLDHIGPMATCVEDLAILLDAISGHDANDESSLHVPPTQLAGNLNGDIDGYVMGINDAFFFNDVDERILGVVWEAIRALESRGASTADAPIKHIEHALFATQVIDTCETSTVHYKNIRQQPENYGDDVRKLIKCGDIPSAVTYLQAQQMRHALQKSFADVFAKVDVLVSPTLPIQVPDIGQETIACNGKQVDAEAGMMRLVSPANLLGLPSLTVPCGLLDGMPVGLQIIGPPLAEAKVLNVGRALEQSGIFSYPGQ